jgi:hypothetical protein
MPRLFGRCRGRATARTRDLIQLVLADLPYAFARRHLESLVNRIRASVRAVTVGECEGRPIALSGSADGTLRVWDLANGAQQSEPLIGHDGGVLSVALGELHGQGIALSGGVDRTVRVWDLTTGAQRGEPFTGHDGGVGRWHLGSCMAGRLRPVAVETERCASGT